MPEWTRYHIKFPAASSHPPAEAPVLDTVRHVVHVPEARRILEDGVLRAGLVYDESRLNKSRTCVTWLSANTWGPGSIYGNVEFCFAWQDIVKERNVYWVEAMTGYSPHAYRLLITDRDLDGSRHVTRYDLCSDRGPLRERDGVWYWNANYTSEFMVDADLHLRRCTGFDFVTHNRDRCRLHGRNCPDRSAPTYGIGGRVLAFLLGNDFHTIDRVLKKPSVSGSMRPLSDAVDVGVDGICRAFDNNQDRFRGVIRAEASRQAVVRGALALYGADQRDSALSLIALLKSRDVFEQALEAVVNVHFGIAGWTLPD